MKRVFVLFAGAALVAGASITSVETAPQAPAPSAAGDHRSGPDLHQGHRADRLRQVRRLPPRGEVAPMSLLTYDEVRPWARAIKRKVVAREMPPWGADPAESLPMRNDVSLSADQIRTIAAWVDAGAPKGADADLPPPPTFSSGWTYGKEPDAVLEMPIEFDIPAEGELGVQMLLLQGAVGRGPLRGGRRTAARQPQRWCTTPASTSSTSPKAATLKDGHLVDADGNAIGDRGAKGLRRRPRRAARVEQAAVVGARARRRRAPRRHRQADPRRQVHQLADALQPDRQAGEGSDAPRLVVQQGAGHPRGADPPGRRPAGHHQGGLSSTRARAARSSTRPTTAARGGAARRPTSRPTTAPGASPGSPP